MAANIELINSAVRTVFTTTRDEDLAIYTDTNNQQIHFGCGSNGTTAASMVVTSSNIHFNYDISVLNRQFNLTKLSIARNTAGGTVSPVNITTAVSSIPQFSPSNGTNYDFSLNNTQTLFRFLDSVGQVEAAITNTGNLTLAGNITTPSNITCSNVTTSNLTAAGNITCSNNLVINGSISANNLGMFRNKIINGDMRIDQRGFAATGSNNFANQGYVVDRMFLHKEGAATWNVQQVNINFVVPEFRFAFRNTIGTSTSTINVGDFYILAGHHIEGLNVNDLAWGTSGAQQVTISFWFYSSLPATQTFFLVMRNGIANRSYVAPFDAPSNTWTRVVRTVQGDTTGSWAQDHNVGISVFITTAVGTNFQTPNTAEGINTWVNGNRIGASHTVGAYAMQGSANTFINTANAFIQITGLQFERGNIATPFEFRPFPVELQMCQRYYESSVRYGVSRNSIDVSGDMIRIALVKWGGSSTSFGGPVYFRASKRIHSYFITTWNGVGTYIYKVRKCSYWLQGDASSATLDLFTDYFSPTGFSVAVNLGQNGFVGFAWEVDAEF